MPVTVNYVTSQDKIHSGSGFVFLNILRPLYLTRPIATGNPPRYADPAAPGTWTMTQSYTVGEIIVDQNGNVEMVTTAGTSGATEPLASAWANYVGGATTDGTVTWTNIGPTYVWTASVAVPYGAEVRDANDNIQFAQTPGTTGGTTPSWATVIGATTVDGTVTWVNLGPTIGVGAVEGEVTFDITPKLLTITADQYTGIIAHRPMDEVGKITGTLEEVNMQVIQTSIPGTSYTSGTDPNQAANAQAFEQVTGGGKLQVLTPCVAIISPRPNYSNPNKYVMGWLNQAAPQPTASFPVSLKKVTTYKVDFEGEMVTWMPGGAMMYGFARLT